MSLKLLRIFPGLFQNVSEPRGGRKQLSLPEVKMMLIFLSPWQEVYEGNYPITKRFSFCFYPNVTLSFHSTPSAHFSILISNPFDLFLFCLIQTSSEVSLRTARCDERSQLLSDLRDQLNNVHMLERDDDLKRAERRGGWCCFIRL